MKYQALIFDLDGTLLDTLDDLADGVNAALRAYNHPEKTRDEVCAAVGNGMLNLMDRVIPGGRTASDFDQIFAYFKQYYAAHCEDKTAPYVGIPEQLLKWRDAGVKMAIVSNKIDGAVQNLNDDFFHRDIALGEREGMARKPAPDSVFLAMNELSAEPSRTVYIGDSDVDMITACNAGAVPVGVAWGYRPADVLRENGAAYTPENAEDLYRVLTSLA